MSICYYQILYIANTVLCSVAIVDNILLTPTIKCMVVLEAC